MYQHSQVLHFPSNTAHTPNLPRVKTSTAADKEPITNGPDLTRLVFQRPMVKVQSTKLSHKFRQQPVPQNARA